MIYIASRVKHAPKWRKYRASSGAAIISSWIYEAEEGQTSDLSELWARIRDEISLSSVLVFYAEADDFPLKGALVEVGIAMALRIPIRVVTPGVCLDKNCRPVGSWMRHKSVQVFSTVEEAFIG